MNARRTGLSLTTALAFGLVACSGGEPPAEGGGQAAPEATQAAQPSQAPMQVMITSPTEGAVLPPGPVHITLEVRGLTIVPAGDETPRSGHHHLIVDADLPPLDAPIPSVEGKYIHMGAAQTEYDLTGLQPGEHTVIALVGDFAHVPLDPPVADTVHFVIRE